MLKKESQNFAKGTSWYNMIKQILKKLDIINFYLKSQFYSFVKIIGDQSQHENMIMSSSKALQIICEGQVDIGLLDQNLLTRKVIRFFDDIQMSKNEFVESVQKYFEVFERFLDKEVSSFIELPDNSNSNKNKFIKYFVYETIMAYYKSLQNQKESEDKTDTNDNNGYDSEKIIIVCKN